MDRIADHCIGRDIASDDAKPLARLPSMTSTRSMTPSRSAMPAPREP
jgi:hypothetical protein